MRFVLDRLLPRGPVDLLRQIICFCGAYWLYRVVRGLEFGHAALAIRHARDVVGLERSLHVFVEPSIQSWAISTGWVDSVASWLYLNVHFVVTTFTLAFIYLFRNEHFYFVRNMFMLAMGLALVAYIVYPCAPPRMFGDLGFVDSVSNFTGVSSDSSVNALFNEYAAVPSMHAAFALMLSVPMVRMARSGWVKALWCFYAPLVSMVVIITANHWIFDVATGALTAAVSAVAAHVLFARFRPQAWAWTPGSHENALPASVRAG
jgi:membrane-associated phospholipid phosphatase